jgi:cytochrome c oxidase subunit III
MAHASTHAPTDKYYVPHHSPWPIVGSVALFTTVGGAALWLNNAAAGPWVLTLGLLILLTMFAGWFGAVIRESEARLYNAAVDRSFRMGMMWFIFSEVMFFAAFFGALWYAREYSVPWLGGEGVKVFTNFLLWNDYEAAWPTDGPGNVGGDFEVIPAFGLPAINTAILLTSGVTITIAHHALKSGNRTVLNIFLAATFLLGFLFVGLQAMEYVEAYQHYNLKLTSGIYGSTFFMLTGFHGFHVTVGAIMLTVIWLRCLKGHFTPNNHFAFEATAWYWHFVDVVWLGLFIFVYWL